MAVKRYLEAGTSYYSIEVEVVETSLGKNKNNPLKKDNEGIFNKKFQHYATHPITFLFLSLLTSIVLMSLRKGHPCEQLYPKNVSLHGRMCYPLSDQFYGEEFAYITFSLLSLLSSISRVGLYLVGHPSAYTTLEMNERDSMVPPPDSVPHSRIKELNRVMEHYRQLKKV